MWCSALFAKAIDDILKTATPKQHFKQHFSNFHHKTSQHRFSFTRYLLCHMLKNTHSRETITIYFLTYVQLFNRFNGLLEQYTRILLSVLLVQLFSCSLAVRSVYIFIYLFSSLASAIVLFAGRYCIVTSFPFVFIMILISIGLFCLLFCFVLLFQLQFRLVLNVRFALKHCLKFKEHDKEIRNQKKKNTNDIRFTRMDELSVQLRKNAELTYARHENTKHSTHDTEQTQIFPKQTRKN